MNELRWLDYFRRALKKQALPSWYVEHLVRELTDHFDDIKENRCMEANTVGTSSNLGNPIEIARATKIAFDSRSYLQRHPRAKRLVVAAIVVGLVAVILLKGSATPATAQYEVTTKITGKDRKTLFAPKILIRSNEVATVGMQDEKTEYQLDVKAGNGSADAQHAVNMRFVAKDSDGRKRVIYAPCVLVSTDETAQIQDDNIRFDVCVASHVNVK